MLEIIKAGGIEVHIDEDMMRFNEANLMMYLQKEGPQFAYLLSKLAELEAAYEKAFAEKFVEYKDEGGTEKYVEARCKSCPDLASYLYAIKKVKNHLRAWDINHDNAQSFGHNLRKEMEKLNNDIRFSSPAVDERVMEILRETHKKDKEDEEQPLCGSDID